MLTYHLPLRVLLLPEGGDLRYYRLFSQSQFQLVLIYQSKSNFDSSLLSDQSPSIKVETIRKRKLRSKIE
mgnify:CR=1 FL=1